MNISLKRDIKYIMISNKKKIIDDIIEKINKHVKKISSKGYSNKWNNKVNQICLIDSLNEVDFENYQYVETKNKYLIDEFEKSNDTQKKELIIEFEKLLPLTDRAIRHRKRNDLFGGAEGYPKGSECGYPTGSTNPIVRPDGSTNIIKKETQVKEKRPPNSFINFCKINRPIVISEIPTIKKKKIIGELSKRWKKLDSNEKNIYKFTPLRVEIGNSVSTLSTPSAPQPAATLSDQKARRILYSD